MTAIIIYLGYCCHYYCNCVQCLIIQHESFACDKWFNNTIKYCDNIIAIRKPWRQYTLTSIYIDAVYNQFVIAAKSRVLSLVLGLIIMNIERQSHAAAHKEVNFIHAAVILDVNDRDAGMTWGVTELVVSMLDSNLIGLQSSCYNVHTHSRSVSPRRMLSGCYRTILPCAVRGVGTWLDQYALTTL